MKVIGIPVSISKTQYFINQAYVDYVTEAGFAPLLIALEKKEHQRIDFLSKMCDGLLLPGGVDLEPTYYGEENVASMHVEPEKDSFERALFYKFVNAGKPVFGICRGFQLIVREYLKQNEGDCVWLEYYQHLNEHSRAEALEIPRTVPSHAVDITMNLYGGNPADVGTMFVNSMHHQAVIARRKNRPEDSTLSVVAWSDAGLGSKERSTRTVVEGVRIKSKGINILAVQWHPEELKDYRLIREFFLSGEKVKKAGA